MSNTLIHLTDETFEEEVLNSDLPVLVDYWSESCGPCKAIAPVIDDMVDTYEGRLKVCKIIIDENPDSVINYNVISVPTLLIFKNGKVEASRIGSMTRSQLMSFIDDNL